MSDEAETFALKRTERILRGMAFLNKKASEGQEGGQRAGLPGQNQLRGWEMGLEQSTDT